MSRAYFISFAEGTRELHTHFSAVAAGGIFLAVLVMGSLWRLIAAHLCASNNDLAQNIGQAMAFQY